MMLFDLYAGGHHGQYVRQLVEYWLNTNVQGKLSIVAPPGFLERHDDVRRIIKNAACDNLRFHPVEEEVFLRSDGTTAALIHNQREHGRLFRKYVEYHRPDHCICMYFDHMQLSLALGLRFAFDVKISGIYFRPAFHYESFSSHSSSGKDRILNLRKRALLLAALRNRHVSTLFCLDPYVVDYVKKLSPRIQVVALPDGVPAHQGSYLSTDLRAQHHVGPDRRFALLFGSLAERKGIFQTLEALTLLSPADQKTLCVALIGSVNSVDKDRLHRSIHRVQNETDVHVILDDRFVLDEEIQGMLGSSDLLLMPYQHHVGSSGVLVRAAMALVPVLGPDYGLVGEQIQRHELVLYVDTTSPFVLAESLSQWLSDPETIPFDKINAEKFAEANTAAKYSETIFKATTEGVLEPYLSGQRRP